VDQGGLNADERREVEELTASGFADWNRQEFNDFILGSERFGRNNIEGIQDLIKTKTLEEVRIYK
jgi:SWI/SNF-related matrix-associated actin-dependent regulator of chromatin subfamily A member 5